jgi:glutamate-ammonia-ligase adenylyltransferase
VKNKFSFSKGFISNIIEQTRGIISSDILDSFISSLEKEASKYHFNYSSEGNLLRIMNSIYDKSSFINEIIKYPHHAEIIISVSSNSNYLTDIVVGNPGYLYQVFDQDYLSKEIEEDNLLNELNNSSGRYKSLPAKLNYLRQSKKRYILKIGLTDILQINDLPLITEQLSVLAKSINAVLFGICYNEIISKYELEIVHSKYCLCSLGKLGGNELNYSSDVDLLLFYDNNEFYDGIKKEYQEILSEVALLFIKSSSEISDKGYIYRVDFRLRPDGKYSPLCKALPDYTKYYEMRGEDWERQMLIKLDFIAGNESLYKSFYEFLKPYIYPSSISGSPKEQIKKMKQNIEAHNKEKENVKLFKGGIRDIEFSIQALQLMNGGKYPELRTGNTLNAISLLFDKGLLKTKERKILSGAYIFYRRIEHYLQLMNDTQTHLIPEDDAILKKLSLYLGFKSTSDFKSKLLMHRKEVRNIYDSILSGEKSDQLPFDNIGFKDPNRALKNWSYISSGIGVFGQKEFDMRTINLFERIKPGLYKYLVKTEFPDRVLDNFVKTIRSVSITSIWYNELCDTKFLKSVLTLCEYSDKCVNLMVMDKTCSELLLSRKVFTELTEPETFQLTLNQILFYLSARFTFGLVEQDALSKILTGYLENRIITIAMQFKINSIYFFAGLGSFATHSMNFSSDIDLVCVVDSVNEFSAKQQEFQKLIISIQENLKPFLVDFKLRPEGKSSQLVWSIDKFNDYIKSRARVWEFQAFSKLRFVFGKKELFDDLVNTVVLTIDRIDKDKIRAEIKQMANSISRESIKLPGSSFNIKKDRGGLTTIEFIIDSIILSDNLLLGETINRNRMEILKFLLKGEVKGDVKVLLRNFRILKSIEFAIQNIFDVNNTVIPASADKKEIVANWLNVKKKIQLEIQLKHLIKENNSLFEKYV